MNQLTTGGAPSCNVGKTIRNNPRKSPFLIGAMFIVPSQSWVVYDIVVPTLQDGAPKIAKLPYKWFYGRYNYS